VAAVYDEFLSGLDGVRPQRVRPGDRHAYVHWAACFENAGLAARLAELGIGTRNYYGPVLHRLTWPTQADPSIADSSITDPSVSGPLVSGRAVGGLPLPVTDLLADQVLALPMSSELTVDVAEQVASIVRKFA
jgi:dTDP-4-amino-4,6-dideoxygalactose transaminase